MNGSPQTVMSSAMKLSGRAPSMGIPQSGGWGWLSWNAEESQHGCVLERPCLHLGQDQNRTMRPSAMTRWSRRLSQWLWLLLGKDEQL